VSVSQSVVGRMSDGTAVEEYRLTNARGTQADILSLGAALRALHHTDALGAREDIVLGFDRFEEYLEGRHYFGATVGRYANRIARGQFRLEGKLYQIPLSDPPNSEHGGEEGFDRRVWRMQGTHERQGPALTLALVSPDGDQGFPGELRVELTYTLTDANELRIDYRASTSAPTIINLTNHSYWCLAGAAGGDALGAHLKVEADVYTPVDAHLIPTGELRSVAGTVFDFRAAQPIAARIREGSEPQLAWGRGYDHNFVLRGAPGGLRPAARLEEFRSGRVLEVLTTEPGLQLYTGNFLSGGIRGKGRRLYRQGDGIALETQHFPDSPNHANFPSTVLVPGRVWSSTTIYRLHAQPRNVVV
jgi:aldose 1-epimerase